MIFISKENEGKLYAIEILKKTDGIYYLAREGDYEMMPVCACVRACVRVCVRALVSHADSSKTTTATDFL